MSILGCTNGAATVYGPQKGATPEMVLLLDEGLRHLAELVKQEQGIEILEVPGSGAAGGLGGGLLAFCGAQLKPGLEVIDEIIDLRGKIGTVDLVVTGEGLTDQQTLFGKLPVGLAQMAKSQNVPVIVISGGVKGNINDFKGEGVTAVFSTTPYPLTLDEAISNAQTNLFNTTLSVFSLVKLQL